MGDGLGGAMYGGGEKDVRQDDAGDAVVGLGGGRAGGRVEGHAVLHDLGGAQTGDRDRPARHVLADCASAPQPGTGTAQSTGWRLAPWMGTGMGTGATDRMKSIGPSTTARDSRTRKSIMGRPYRKRARCGRVGQPRPRPCPSLLVHAYHSRCDNAHWHLP